MPRDFSIKKVMVIGSGPIVIGQAAEFDYAGTQACRALREEGCEVVLVNSNPATIMTDVEMADRVYIEPLTVGFAGRILEQERPDGLLPTLGGQTGLNLATQLAAQGWLDRFQVRLLGTPLASIQKAEDREEFRRLMQEIGQPVPESWIIEEVAALRELAGRGGLPYPLIIRPAYTLGGTGGGIAQTPEELVEIGTLGLKLSMRHQILVERCLVGWKEIEYEVMRDSADTCITVCNMENFDPMGIHTGDSIVVAPSQTLSDKEYQMLRSASLSIIRALRIEGGCNVQLALDPHSFQYFVIEVNPRVSRSSALASKATGYPIARVAAKIAVGLRLDEIENAVTKKTLACFEPALDYCVVKIPRWPFDKFHSADRVVGTQMKATGEVMAIGRTFEAALLKAARSLEVGVFGLRGKNISTWSDMQVEEGLRRATDERLFVVAEAFRRGWLLREVQELSNIDPWFLHKIRALLQLEARMRGIQSVGSRQSAVGSPDEPSLLPTGDAAAVLTEAKRLGFSDRSIAALCGVPEATISACRRALGLRPVYKMVDTCAAEFEAQTPYFYSTYEAEDEGAPTPSPSPNTGGGEQGKGSDRSSPPPVLGEGLGVGAVPAKKVIVIGSGPIRIGQGIEFDYCSVHGVWALREAGYESIIINNNPETVSTDFDTSDRLYFEPLTAEDVLEIVHREQPDGVIVQFGGQTAINLAQPLHEAGVRLFGTSYESIDIAEDREKFERLLRELGIPKPVGRAVKSVEAALEVAEEIGYPVLVRPSYVLGGRAMQIVSDRQDLLTYMTYAVDVSPDAPILVDKYVLGKEVEVDVISDGEDCLIPGIMEHIERAGVHSGDSMAVYPPQTLSESVIRQVIRHSIDIARALKLCGLMNIQFVVDRDEVSILEVNPRASRTVPYLSKITGVPMVRLATQMMLGQKLKDLGYETGLYAGGNYGIGRPAHHVSVKAPVFSFAKLTRVDVNLGPEMKSTGEIMGSDRDYPHALYKAMVASGVDVPAQGTLIATIADADKEEALPIIRRFSELGFRIYATGGTARFLNDHGIDATRVNKIKEGSNNLVDLIQSGQVDLLVNTISKDRQTEREAALIRRASVENGIPCLTSLDTARALLTALATKAESRESGHREHCATIDEYLKG